MPSLTKARGVCTCIIMRKVTRRIENTKSMNKIPMSKLGYRNLAIPGTVAASFTAVVVEVVVFDDVY